LSDGHLTKSALMRVRASYQASLFDLVKLLISPVKVDLPIYLECLIAVLFIRLKDPDLIYWSKVIKHL